MDVKNKVRISAIQSKTFMDLDDTLNYVEDKISEAMKEKPDFIILPEMFSCPYRPDFFPVYAEEGRGKTWEFLSKQASKNSVYLIGGSIPESYEGKVFNTSFVFDRMGEEIAKHRKMHLFDVDVPGGISFHESDSLTAGDYFTTFDTVFGKAGLMICFDVRFPELTAIYKKMGCRMMFVPGAFNMTTGPAHWELLMRARAMDSQTFVIACAPARDEKGVYTSWGHSMITHPWGNIVASLDEKEGILTQDIDLGEIIPTMQGMPVNLVKRLDLYEVKVK